MKRRGHRGEEDEARVLHLPDGKDERRGRHKDGLMHRRRKEDQLDEPGVGGGVSVEGGVAKDDGRERDHHRRADHRVDAPVDERLCHRD